MLGNLIDHLHRSKPMSNEINVTLARLSSTTPPYCDGRCVCTGQPPDVIRWHIDGHADQYDPLIAGTNEYQVRFQPLAGQAPWWLVATLETPGGSELATDDMLVTGPSQ